MRNLPTLPLIVTRLLELIEDPGSAIQDLQEVISMDLALTAKVLKLANSAYYGYPREISTLTQAVIVLGLNTIKSLVLAASAYNIFYKELPGYKMARGGLWFHSFLTASFAKMIAKKKVPAAQETAFIAGLLHDMGKQVMSC